MKLTSYRESRGLSIREAAAQLGVSHETMRRYENGERTPSVEMIELIGDWSGGAVSSGDFVNQEVLARLRKKAPGFSRPIVTVRRRSKKPVAQEERAA